MHTQGLLTVDRCPLTFQKEKNMKKYIITLVFALGLGLNLSAQNDGFFTSNYSEFRTTTDDMGDMPALFGHGMTSNQDAPLGGGLLVLGGLALAYGLRKKN